MAALTSKLTEWFARVITWGMVALALPVGIGLLAAVLARLESIEAWYAPIGTWVAWGFLTYVGVHLLFYRPAPLFRASHRMFSVIAVWLFGGQVSTVEGGANSKGERAGKGAKGTRTQAKGSTLVAFSPYVVPVYLWVTCAAAWLLGRWLDPIHVNAPVGFVVGMAIAFHWLMTADDLQEQRKHWHVETYLLAVSLIFVITLVAASAAVAWALPDYQFVPVLADGLSRAHAMYAHVIDALFL